MGQSWSAIRKQLEEDLLCEKLRGRVQYFFTIYHKAPDQYGRFAIRVDGTELYQANPYNERYYYAKELAEDEAARQAIAAGNADSYDVLRCINKFLNQPIEKSLWSDHLLLRMFAILDRRIGKRTLVKLAATYDSLPDWLKQFYNLRFAVEKIIKKGLKT